MRTSATSDINFNVSGLFSAPAPQDKVSDKPASEELPSIPTPTPATVPALGLAPTLASVATKERAESEAPHRPTSPKVSRSPPEAAAPAEEMARRTKRPASARPTMPPPPGLRHPQLPSSTTATPWLWQPCDPSGSALPSGWQQPPGPHGATPVAPVAPQPARHQSRHSPASPSPASPGPASLSPVTLSLPAHVDLGAATEEGEGPEAAGRAPTAPVIPPQAQPRSLASETN
ncbi:hypothetical protein K5549_004387 [Capra hircus]|nr:hypothetical protein K5549_004387 [Capra hircus]